MLYFWLAFKYLHHQSGLFPSHILTASFVTCLWLLQKGAGLTETAGAGMESPSAFLECGNTSHSPDVCNQRVCHSLAK